MGATGDAGVAVGSRRFLLRWLKPLAFGAALLPLLKIGVDGLRGGLGANPIAEVLNRLGFWTLTHLTLTLACTPAKILFRITWPLRLRRMLGLFAFTYAALHFSVYVGVDQFFDFDAIAKDVTQRPFIMVGFTAFLLLIPLAVTSTKAALRRLGFRRWQRLHRLVYLIAGLGVLHFVWRVKADHRLPYTFATILGALLAVRLGSWALKRRAGGREKHPARPAPSALRSRSSPSAPP